MNEAPLFVIETNADLETARELTSEVLGHDPENIQSGRLGTEIVLLMAEARNVAGVLKARDYETSVRRYLG